MMEGKAGKNPAEDGSSSPNVAASSAAGGDNDEEHEEAQAMAPVDKDNATVAYSLPAPSSEGEETGPDFVEGKQEEAEAGEDTPATDPDPTRFPYRLHRMLTEIEEGEIGLEGFVSWQPHGRCFMIRDKRGFIDTVMPKYFYQLKYVSFQRQLNLYGFKKIYSQGPDKGAYYHDLFLRGKTDLAGSIERVRPSKERERNKSKSEDPEINFYALPAIDDKAEQSIKDRERALEEEKKAPPAGKKRAAKQGDKRKRGKAKAGLKSGGGEPKQENKMTKDATNSSGLDPNPIPQSIATLPNLQSQLIGFGEGFSPSASSGLADRNFAGANFNDILAPNLASASSTNTGTSPFDIQRIRQQLIGGGLFDSNPATLMEANPMGNLGRASLGMNNPSSGTTPQQQQQSNLHSLQPTIEQMAALLGGAAGTSSSSAATGQQHQLGELEPTPLKPGMTLQSGERPSSNPQSTIENPLTDSIADQMQQHQQWLQLEQLHQQQQQQLEQHRRQQLQIQQQQFQLQQQQELFGYQRQEQEQAEQQQQGDQQPSFLFPNQQQQRLLGQLQNQTSTLPSLSQVSTEQQIHQHEQQLQQLQQHERQLQQLQQHERQLQQLQQGERQVQQLHGVERLRQQQQGQQQQDDQQYPPPQQGGGGGGGRSDNNTNSWMG